VVRGLRVLTYASHADRQACNALSSLMRPDLYSTPVAYVWLPAHRSFIVSLKA
jgi:hypothetical protein